MVHDVEHLWVSGGIANENGFCFDKVCHDVVAECARNMVVVVQMAGQE